MYDPYRFLSFGLKKPHRQPRVFSNIFGPPLSFLLIIKLLQKMFKKSWITVKNLNLELFNELRIMYQELLQWGYGYLTVSQLFAAQKKGRTGCFIYDGLRPISLGCKQKQKNTNTVQKPNTVLVAVCHFPPSPYRVLMGSSANKSPQRGYL